jgi:putative Mn2+ efflux pump MntP
MIGKILKYGTGVGVMIGILQLRPIVPNVELAVFTIMTLLLGVMIGIDNIKIERTIMEDK